MRSYREYVVDKVVQESESAKSFYLRSTDGEPLQRFLPGQYLPVKLTVGGTVVYRCYTLSDCFNESHYRLTIKREPAQSPDVPRGRVSNHFHDELAVNSVVEAQAPAGEFFLEVDSEQPVALIAGGIGITPMISMLNACLATATHREIYLLYAVRNSASHAFKERLWQAAQEHENVHVSVLYSQPVAGDISGRDFDQLGRLNFNVLRRVLPDLAMQFFICGPNSMMVQLSEDLISAGVSAGDIHREDFQVAKTSPPVPRVAIGDPLPAESEISVDFRRSGRVLPWDSRTKSLLTFALENDVPISSGCSYGDCGTCMTTLLSGAVAYGHKTGIDPDPGSCLPCSCKPTTSVVLDA